MSFLEKFFIGRRKKPLPEILLVDKPSGMTSYDVIRKIKGEYGREHDRLKIGHAGTLDPSATGLLMLGIGEGTKKMSEFLKLPKTYEAHILLGIKTDTGDMEGKVLEEAKVRFVDEKEVEKTLKSLVGEVALPVPAYSAVKQGGEPLYKKARRGEKVSVPIKKMRIERIELLGLIKDLSASTCAVGTADKRIHAPAYALACAQRASRQRAGRQAGTSNEKIILFVEMVVGSGAYVRSIAEEIGRRLKLPATVKMLRRTKIGDFSVTDLQTLAKI